MGKKFGFSWKRALGISAAKGRLSRQIGIPLTRSGRRQKVGRLLGCCVPFLAMVTVLGMATSAFAHPGRTDAGGGHHDRINGGYHYHNGGHSDSGGTSNTGSSSGTTTSSKEQPGGGFGTNGPGYYRGKSRTSTPAVPGDTSRSESVPASKPSEFGGYPTTPYVPNGSPKAEGEWAGVDPNRDEQENRLPEGHKSIKDPENKSNKRRAKAPKVDDDHEVYCSMRLREYHWRYDCSLLKNSKPVPLTLKSVKYARYAECKDCRPGNDAEADKADTRVPEAK